MNVQLEAGDVAPDASLALQSLTDLGFKFARCRPARLEVADEALGAQLAAALADPELAVSVRDGLPAVQQMVRQMAAQLEDAPPPDALDAPGVTVVWQSGTDRRDELRRVRPYRDGKRYYATFPGRAGVRVGAPREGGGVQEGRRRALPPVLRRRGP